MLLQAGLESASDTAGDDFLQLLEAGARNLGSLNDSVDLPEESRQQLWRQIVSIGDAERFVILTRSDRSGSRVVYCGEDSVVDDIDALGNHLLEGTDGVEHELGEFFGNFAVAGETSLRCPVGRFGADAAPVDGEDPQIAELASDDSVNRLAIVACPAQAKATSLRWRNTPEKLFAVSNDGDDVIFTAMSSTDAVAAVVEVLETVPAPRLA